MNYFVKFFLIAIFIFITSCKNNDTEFSVIEEKDLDLQMIDAYKKGLEALEEGDVLFAAKNFNLAENIHDG